MKKLFLAVIAASSALGLAAASADGVEPAGDSGGAVLRFGSSGESGVTVKTENGVKVYRGAPRKRAMLRLATAPAATRIIEREKVIIKHYYHSRYRHLCTQGLYSGHCGRHRRFTQGFYSGPIDLGC